MSDSNNSNNSNNSDKSNDKPYIEDELHNIAQGQAAGQNLVNMLGASPLSLLSCAYAAAYAAEMAAGMVLHNPKHGLQERLLVARAIADARDLARQTLMRYLQQRGGVLH